MSKTINLFLVISLAVFAIFSAVLILQKTDNLGLTRDNHLVLLAQQFSLGNVSLSPFGLPDNDYVDFFGKQYLYFGPLSSIILIPFALAFGRTFPQVSLGISALILTFLATYLLSKKLRFSSFDSLWLSIFICFSTVLFAVSILNISAYQVQALGALFIFLALSEYVGRRRMLLIGILIALAGLTRLTLYFSTVFFLLPLVTPSIKKEKIIQLLLPIFLSLLLFGAYNYKRFHSPIETGYRYNVTLSGYPMKINLTQGFESVTHAPANLYSLLVKSPDPIVEKGGGYILKFPYLRADPWGMAIWFTSPLFLLLFRLRRADFDRKFITTILVLGLPSLLYFGVGFSQFGYRYSLDFLPFLFLLLIKSFRGQLPGLAKGLITVGVVFNCLYMASIWGLYPVFNFVIK